MNKLKISLRIKSMYRLIFILLIYSVIIVFSLSPGVPIGDVNIPNIDKILHFCAYFTLSLLIVILFHKRYEIFFLQCSSVIISVIIEFLQDAIPGRESSFLDILANIIGISVGILVGYYLKKYLQKKRVIVY